MGIVFDRVTFQISQTTELTNSECFTTPKRTLSILGSKWWLECYPKGKSEKDTMFQIFLRVSRAPMVVTVNYAIIGTDISGSANCIFETAKSIRTVMQRSPFKCPNNAVFTCRTEFISDSYDSAIDTADSLSSVEMVTPPSFVPLNSLPTMSASSVTTASFTNVSALSQNPTKNFSPESDMPLNITDTAIISLSRANFDQAGFCISTPKRVIKFKELVSWWLDVYPCGKNPNIPGLVLIFLRVSYIPIDVVAEYQVDNTNIAFTSKHRYLRSDALGCSFGHSHSQLIKAGVFGLDSFNITCHATFSIPLSQTPPCLGVLAKAPLVLKKKKIRNGFLDYSLYTPNDLVLDSSNFLVGIPLKTEILKNAVVGEMYKTREYVFPGNFDYSYQLYCYPGGDQPKSAGHVSVFVEFRTMSFQPFVVTGKWGLTLSEYEKNFEYIFESQYGWGGFTIFVSHENLFQRGLLKDGGVTITFTATVKAVMPVVPSVPSVLLRSPVNGALVVGIERIPIQTQVLAHISPVFKRRFIEHPYDTDISVLEFNANQIKAILKLLAGGSVEMNVSLCVHTLKFASKFDVTVLETYAEQWLLSKLTIETFFSIAESAWDARSKVLQMACGRFLDGHMSMVTCDPNFVKLNPITLKNLFVMAQQYPRWQLSHSSGLKLRFWVLRYEENDAK